MASSAIATCDSNLDLPEWMVCGESVILRQSNYSGIIAFIGPTDFATGLWIGIELDAPLGNYTPLYNARNSIKQKYVWSMLCYR